MYKHTEQFYTLNSYISNWIKDALNSENKALIFMNYFNNFLYKIVLND